MSFEELLKKMFEKANRQMLCLLPHSLNPCSTQELCLGHMSEVTKKLEP